MKNNQSPIAIQPRELHQLLREGRPGQLLDVRTPGEFAAAHVPGAKLVPLDELDAAAFGRERADKRIPIYVLCQSGGRARRSGCPGTGDGERCHAFVDRPGERAGTRRLGT